MLMIYAWHGVGSPLVDFCDTIVGTSLIRQRDTSFHLQQNLPPLVPPTKWWSI